MWTNFKVFIELVTVLLLFYVLVFWLQGMWGLSSLTRDGTHTSCIGRWSLNHWTAREVPRLILWFFMIIFLVRWLALHVFVYFMMITVRFTYTSLTYHSLHSDNIPRLLEGCYASISLLLSFLLLLIIHFTSNILWIPQFIVIILASKQLSFNLQNE